MQKLPNIIFVIDTNIESLAILEAKKLNIPIIGILDSNSDPDNIDFPIPGNDDARRAIDLYCNLVKDTIVAAKKVAPSIELKNTPDKKDQEDKKNKTLHELDREKLEKKILKKKSEKLN